MSELKTLMRDAGVSVTYTDYPRIIHDFVMLNGLADSEAAKAAVAQATEALRQALHT